MWRNSPSSPSALCPHPSHPPTLTLPRSCDLHSLSDWPRTCCQSCLFTCPLVVESLELSGSFGVTSSSTRPVFFSVLQAAVHAGSPSCQREQGAYCLFAFQSNLLLESDIFFFCLPSFGETGFPSSWVTVTSRWTQTHINTSAEKKHSSSLFVCRLGENHYFLAIWKKMSDCGQNPSTVLLI